MKFNLSTIAFISRKEQELKVLLPTVDNEEDYQNMLSLAYK